MHPNELGMKIMAEGWYRTLMRLNELFGEGVQRSGGDTGLNSGADLLEEVGDDPASPCDELDFLPRLELDQTVTILARSWIRKPYRAVTIPCWISSTPPSPGIRAMTPSRPS